MRLVFIHGAAAVGKYTVARELAARTGFELYHNHLVVDAVLERHAFGTPAFIALRDRLWREFFSAFPSPARPRIIFTFNPENTVPQAFIDWLFQVLAGRGVAVHGVELVASEAVLEARIGTAQRHQFRKLTDVALYRRLRDSGTFATPLLPPADLRLDTGTLTAIEAAAQIARHFALVATKL